MIINTRSDLDSFKGSPDYAAALRAILGATTTWINHGTAEAPDWHQETALSHIERLAFADFDEFLAECEAAGVSPETPTPPSELTPLSVQALKAYAAEKRRVLANGSTVVDVGAEREIHVWTDAESRGAILGLVVAAGIDPSLTTQWKGADGVFHELNASEVTALALGMMAWVQACFAAEAAVLAGIEADPPTITSFEDVDSADWPTAA